MIQCQEYAYQLLSKTYDIRIDMKIMFGYEF